MEKDSNEFLSITASNGIRCEERKFVASLKFNETRWRGLLPVRCWQKWEFAKDMTPYTSEKRLELETNYVPFVSSVTCW